MNVQKFLWTLVIFLVLVVWMGCSESTSSAGDQDTLDSDNTPGGETSDTTDRQGNVSSTVLVCDTIDFGTVSLLQTVSKSCKIAIEGTDPVTIQDVSRSSETTPEFSVDSVTNARGLELSLPFTLSSTDEAFIQIAYRPVDQGTDEGVIVVTSDSRFNPSQTIGVVSKVQGDSKLIVQEELDFGSTSTRETKRLELIIENNNDDGGNRTLAIAAITLSRNNGSFSLDASTCTASREEPILIGQGQSHSCEVRFSPLSDGEKSATVIVDSDASTGEPMANVKLKGVGTTPTLTLEPSNMDFGLVETGTSSYRTLHLTNLGDVPVNLSSCSFPSGVQAFSLLAPNDRVNGKTLEPGESCPMDLLFSPTEAKNYVSQLTFETDSATEPQVTLELSGLGIKPGNSIVLNVHDINGEPIQGALVAIRNGEELGTTDFLGRLLIDTSNADETVISIDGWEALGGPYSTQYRSYSSQTAAISAILERLYPETAQPVQGGAITSLDIPGTSLRFDPEDIEWPDTEDSSTENGLWLQSVHAPALPWPLPESGASFAAIYIGDKHARFSEAAILEYPNSSELAPGSRLPLLRFSEDDLQWNSVATLEITADGDRWVTIEGGIEALGTFAVPDTSLTYTINGMVIERSHDGYVSPIEGAWVFYHHVSARTNASGRYSLENVPGIPETSAGTLYAFRGNTWGQSLTERSETFRWPPSSDTPFEMPVIEFSATPPKGFARGKVLEADALTPVEGASARIDCENGATLLQQSSASGEVAFSDVPVDLDCALTATHPSSGESVEMAFEVDDADSVYDFGDIILPSGDTRAPYIVTAYPSDGQRNVDPMDSIWLRFNEPIVCDTPDETFRLFKKDNAIPGHSVLDEDGLTLRFLPQQALLTGREYRWELLGSVADATGNSLEAGSSATFRTPCPPCPEPSNDCHYVTYNWDEESCIDLILQDNTPCNDGLACTENDRCQAGECISGTTITCSNHGQCQSETGTCLCEEGYTGERCGTCDDGYVGYPSCIPGPDGDEDEQECSYDPDADCFPSVATLREGWFCLEDALIFAAPGCPSSENCPDGCACETVRLCEAGCRDDNDGQAYCLDDPPVDGDETEDEEESPYWLQVYNHGEGNNATFEDIVSFDGESLLAWGRNNDSGEARILRASLTNYSISWIATSSIAPEADSFFLHDARFLSATQGIGVGRGQAGDENVTSLYRFYNGGLLWEARRLTDNPQCSHIDCVDDLTCWVGCDGGKVLRTRDGGQNWTTLSLPASGLHLADLEFVNSLQGWVFADKESLDDNNEPQIDSYGTIWGTPDGGETWSAVQQGLSVLFLRAQFLDAQNGFILVQKETDGERLDEIWQTTDGGWLWQTVSTPQSVETPVGTKAVRELKDISFESLERGWLAGSAGTIDESQPLLLFTENGGNDWESFDIHTLDGTPAAATSILALDFADSLHGLAVGEGPSLIAWDEHTIFPDGDEDEQDVEEEEQFSCTAGTVVCEMSQGVPQSSRCNEDGDGYEAPVLCDANHPDFTGQLPQCYDITCQPGSGLDAGCHFEFQTGQSCTPSNPCIIDGTCNKISGMDICGGHSRTCDDDNDCTEDSCDPYAASSDEACVFEPVADTRTCDDNDGCTENDSCHEGVCVGEAIDGCCPGHPEMVELPSFSYCMDRYENVLSEDMYCDVDGTLYGQSVEELPPDFHEFFPPEVNPDPLMDDEFPDDSPETELYACSVAGQRPSAWLSWQQASRACINQGKRLCHFEEWNYGCGEGHAYPYGESFLEGRCADRTAVPLGGESQLTASRVDDPYFCSWTSSNDPYQVFDASGNVAEWIQPEDENEPLACGGSFEDFDAENLSCSSCTIHESSDSLETVGFRCCIDVEGLCNLYSCNRHGVCDPQTGHCTCNEAYDGDTCDICATGHENYPDCTEIPQPLLHIEPELLETGLDFDQQLAGSVSEPITLTLSNEGNGTLSIEAIEITGDDSSSFVLSPDMSSIEFPITLSAELAEEWVLSVTFEPERSGSHNAVLEITSNDVENSTTQVPLTGLGTDCPLTTHLCGQTCVSNQSVDHCGTLCEPCPEYDHTSATCNGQTCGFLCENSYEDCNGEASDGCETYLLDNPAHCGSCEPCTLANVAEYSCNDGICGVVLCDEGWDDCMEEVEGCETDTTSNRLHCSGCNQACEPAQSDWATYHIRFLHCIESECVTECNLGYLDCDPLQTGCETFPSMDPEHCGSCENDCGALDWSNVDEYSCQQGVCRLVSCESGYDDCDENEENGCETDIYGHPQLGTEASPDHCGGCNQVCNLNHTLDHLCVEGSCKVDTCDEGWADCNGSPLDGCETSTTANLNHCGDCNNRCEDYDWPHVDTYVCQNSTCEVDSCLYGYEDCQTGSEYPGCETDIRNDENGENCGGCDTNCADLPRSCGENCHVAQYSCYAGNCKITTCETDWADCDGDIDNGCEIHLPTDTENCGGCPDDLGHKDCTRYSWYKVNEYQCVDSQCEILTCMSGWADCDGEKSTGCERDLLVDINHCGGCSNAANNYAYRCDFDNADYECFQGECRITSCITDYGDCDGESDNGCERYLPDNDDGWHCGSCDRHCYDQTEACENGECHVSSYTCVDSTCNIDRCIGDYYDCDDNDRNGCEIDISTDNDHCGMCSNPCTAEPFEGALEATCIERECMPTACEIPLTVSDGQCLCIGDDNCDCDGYEVDQTWQNAVTLSEYDEQVHSICPAGDVDWYYIYVSSFTSRVYFRVELNGNGWSSTESPVLSLYIDPTDGPDVTADASDNWQISEIMYPGFYYLKVENLYSGNSVTEYSIEWVATDIPDYANPD